MSVVAKKRDAHSDPTISTSVLILLDPPGSTRTLQVIFTGSVSTPLAHVEGVGTGIAVKSVNL
jgi:hypothetical protein